MTAVTQLVNNLLGGVSTQTDDKKNQGQVVEALNAFPDPTFGMLKRNGFRFIRTIKKRSNIPFKKDELENAAWFFIQRGPDDAYFGAIKGTEIYVWNSITGEACTVDNQGAGYLIGDKPEDYHFRSIQDVTIVTNKIVRPELQPKPIPPTPNSNGTVVLKIVEYSAKYVVTINGVECVYRTRNGDTFTIDGTDPQPNDEDVRLNAEEVLTGIRAAIDGRNLGVNVTQLKTSLEITSGSEFTLSVKGGANNKALESFQDEIADISELPPESLDGRTVKVVNSGGAEDDIYYVYSTEKKEWVEGIARDVSRGFLAASFPHELVFESENQFVFKPIKWTERLVGDDVTNPPPSIFDYDEDSESYTTPGNPITATFFYNNRFGMLSRDNVIFSQANDPYNFFARSAQVQIDSDPIDVNCSSVRPVTLFDVLPSAQGLLLFARREQFLLFGGDINVLTPSTTVVRSLSNYEMDDNIPPVDVGVTQIFVSKVPAYSRVMSMQTRGLEENPIVLDISKVTAGWIPNTIDQLISSSQNSFIACASRENNYIYMYRYFNNGERDLFQAWVKWETLGNVQAFVCNNDVMFAVLQHENQYTLNVCSLNDVPLGAQYTDLPVANPALDLGTRPTSISYDAAFDETRMYIDYQPIEGKTPIMVLTLPEDTTAYRKFFDLVGFKRAPDKSISDADAGYWQYAEVGRDVSGDFFSVPGDLTEYSSGIVVGYPYTFEIQLPKFYFNNGGEGTSYDYTAALTISRVKFSIGKTGSVSFESKAKGSDEWKTLQYVTDADYYNADTAPIESEVIFTVPIHQRNVNFDLKIKSELPFPVSLVSMMWEGNYIPKYYRRS